MIMEPNRRFMFALLCLAALVIVYLFTGCVQISGERVAPDGTALKLRSSRLLWVSQNMEFTTTTADGTSVTLKAENSRSDVEAVQALGEIAKSAINRVP